MRSGKGCGWWVRGNVREVQRYLRHMSTKDLIEEIQRLPVAERIRILEATLRSLREKELKHALSIAAEAMEGEYRTNKVLTEFTDIDLDAFYEAR
jgi:hypothetical protein